MIIGGLALSPMCRQSCELGPLHQIAAKVDLKKKAVEIFFFTKGAEFASEGDVLGAL